MNYGHLSGRKLRDRILEEGYSYDEFAGLINTSASAVRRWVAGSGMQVRRLFSICEVLNCKVEDLTEEE